jgi:hypothetical protein
MRRPRKRGGKVHHAAATMTGKGAIDADALRGRMIVGDELDVFDALNAFVRKVARKATARDAADKRKPRPAPTRDRVVAAMVRDYPAADALMAEKLTNLMAKYKVGKSTVLSARQEALSIIIDGPSRTTDR